MEQKNVWETYSEKQLKELEKLNKEDVYKRQGLPIWHVPEGRERRSFLFSMKVQTS